MYARLSSVLFPVAALLFVGAILWGYQEHQEKNAIMIKAENQYQRAFHDLASHMGSLQDELGQTLAVSSVSQGMQRKGLIKVWRLTSQAQNEISQLPLAGVPFNKAGDFLSRISDFAYRTSVRDLTKQPLSQDEIKTMKSLYAKASDVNKDLTNIRESVMNDHLRWMDVEVAMAGKDEPYNNTIIDGLKAVDKKIGSYPENDWGPAAMASKRGHPVRMLSGKPDVTADKIKQQALAFLGTTAMSGAGRQVNVVENGKNTDMPGYTATVPGPNGENIQMDYTRKGGELLWYMNPRTVKTRKLDFASAKAKAAQFLDQHGYKNMTPVTYDEYDHVSVFTFVGQKNNVKIYTDKVTVRVALDNGEAVGLQASDHVFAPRVLSTGKPKLSQSEARKSLNSDFKVQASSLALIENEENKQVLCYEFVGKVGGEQYRIYINADSGLEESVEKIPEKARALLK
ncbi:germination protein YpeB [Cohnella lubricantis]|uniref:Germination protein YpeB n=1 Tax=Cohnella lubricantis TaxID=2163172 RepID=A0A841TGZ9_9BACL|nr:germination protein YpeB [Cohnella lubricantis]MBB6677721.1 germination protein YpeB [Cohnella lubricantis]MBP2117683.1 spore germination protein [Cohnella lubricantis]